MVPWITEYVSNGFTGTARSVTVDVCRIFLAFAALAKFLGDHRYGGWHYLRPAGYVAHKYRAAHPGWPVTQSGYRVLYVVKFVAAAALLVGVVPHVTALLLAAWLFFELTFDQENHTCLLAMLALLLAVSDGLGDTLTWHTLVSGWTHGFGATMAAELERRSDPFARLLIVVLIGQMYLSTGLRKLRSPRFRSGRVLHRTAEHLAMIAGETPVRQSYFPRWFLRHLALGPHDRLSARWRVAAIGTIALELSLPVLLLTEATWLYAVVLGTLMHAAFAFLLPWRLVSFGTASVGTYALFFGP